MGDWMIVGEYNKAGHSDLKRAAMGKKDKSADGIQVVTRNRRASHEYELTERLECGVVLLGTEVKSLRDGHCSLDGSYAKIESGELWLIDCEIPEYAMGNRLNHKPKRNRKLLAHRRELAKFAGKASERGLRSFRPASISRTAARKSRSRWPVANNCTTSARHSSRPTQSAKWTAPSAVDGKGDVSVHWPPLVESENHVCARYRLRAFAPHLEAAGHSLSLHPLPRDWWGRFAALRSCGDADAVILRRKLLSRPEIAILRHNARRLWFDIDDALWLRDSYSGKPFETASVFDDFVGSFVLLMSLSRATRIWPRKQIELGAQATIR